VASFAKTWERAAHAVTEHTGRPWAFGLAVGSVVLWLGSGPIFGFSDTWQLVINTSTTIITFLMVFLIQHGQNKDSRAIQLKLDEVIRAMKDASNGMIAIEDLTDEELGAIRRRYDALVETAKQEEAERAQGHGAASSGPRAIASSAR
jgi:low affinity Fe/Cu permease